jgi:CheY-like chemotaxis protein
MSLKLLLAGQNKNGFQVVKNIFENEDVDVILATSIGLALFLARKNQPKLILSESQLTDSDALNFFYELKSEEELAKIPFAVISYSENGSPIKIIGDNNNFSEQALLDKNIHSLFLDLQNSAAKNIQFKNRIFSLMTKA